MEKDMCQHPFLEPREEKLVDNYRKSVLELFPLNSGMMTPYLQSAGTRPVCHTFTKSA